MPGLNNDGPPLLQSCKAKTRYRTFEFAEKVRLKCEADRGDKLRVYGCSLCNGFHITKREIKRPD